MKLTNKISLFILGLLGVLVLNTFIGLSQLSRIGKEMESVAKKDIVLTEVVTAITQYQLEKSILFERMLRITEELAYEQVSAARKDHLLDHAKITQKGFEFLAKEGALKITEGKSIIQNGIESVLLPDIKEELSQAQIVLNAIEETHIRYDTLLHGIFQSIEAGHYELSFEDLDKVQSDEKRLNDELKTFLSQVQSFTHKSMVRAEKLKKKAFEVMLWTVSGCVFLSMIIVLALIKGITQPLKQLEKSAYEIGEGQFDIHIDDSGSDEIAHVSKAMNTMSKKLLEARKQLEDQNKQLQESLVLTESQKKDLEKINRELDSFVHTVSHDIKAPLVGILGYGAYLNEKCKDKLDEKGVKSVEGVKRSAERLTDMINDLLTLTKISRIKNPYEDVDIKSLLGSVLERLEFKIQEAKAIVVAESHLPVIRCDRIKMAEVFLNLISNAIKFSSKNNQSQPKIEIRYVDRGSFHEFSVKDNGIGVDPREQGDIFGLFHRAQAAKEYEGTGAGLGIVKNVIDDHGGRVWVESKPAEGATFYFTIPKNL